MLLYIKEDIINNILLLAVILGRSYYFHWKCISTTPAISCCKNKRVVISFTFGYASVYIRDYTENSGVLNEGVHINPILVKYN